VTEVRPLRAYAEIALGRQRSPAHEAGPHMIPYLRAANVRDGVLDLDEDVKEMNFDPVEQKIFSLVRGDVLVTEGSGSLRAVGASAIWNGEIEGTVCFQNTLLRLRPRPATDPRFLAWWCRFAFADGLFASIASGANIFHVSADRVRSLPLTYRPLARQRAIADYLDAETARIDALIEKKRRLVGALSEEFRAAALQKVTGARGSHGGVTRLDWLGDVDGEWPTPQISSIADFFTGTSFPHEYQGKADGEVPFFKVADLALEKDGFYLHSPANFVSHADAEELGGRIVPPQTVVYARVGAALLLNLRRITTTDCLVDDNVRGVQFRRGDVRYWAYLLSLLDLAQFANPGPVPSIAEGQVGGIRVPMPPEDVQRSIADALDERRALIEKTRARIDRQIGLLVEHRQALITAAVTGELAVPGVAA
jgi:type I restriction enzyme, S subunit